MKKRNHGMTLMEIMLAVLIMAIAFLPIMSLLLHNLRVTEKDQSNIIAMNLCKEKLDTALSLDWTAISGSDCMKNTVTEEGATNIEIPSSDGKIKLDLKQYPQTASDKDVVYKFYLSVTKRDGNFNLRLIKDIADDLSPILDSNSTEIPYYGQVYRYTMKVKWLDKDLIKRGKTEDEASKTYTLVTFKTKMSKRG